MIWIGVGEAELLLQVLSFLAEDASFSLGFDVW